MHRVNEASFFEVTTSSSCEDVSGFHNVTFGPGGKAIIGNLRTTTTTLSTTAGSEIPCTAQVQLTNFVVVVSSTTPNTVESRRPAIHKLRQV